MSRNYNNHHNSNKLERNLITHQVDVLKKEVQAQVQDMINSVNNTLSRKNVVCTDFNNTKIEQKYDSGNDFDNDIIKEQSSPPKSLNQDFATLRAKIIESSNCFLKLQNNMDLNAQEPYKLAFDRKTIKSKEGKLLNKDMHKVVGSPHSVPWHKRKIDKT